MQIISSQQGAVTTIRVDVKNEKGQDFLFFASSDLHIDSVYCNRELLLADLQEMVRRRAMGLFFGDIFDAMQGRFDPRRSMAELRPEYRREDYYDFVIRDVGEVLSPYGKNIAMMSDGNHELSVLKNANTNLADRLVERLNNAHGANIRHGAYGGWVRIMITRDGNPVGSVKVKFFHGAGAEAPVTRGVIQTNRQAVYLPDANVVVNGHNHNAYWVPITRERISDKGKVFFDTQQHIRTPGYKQCYGDGTTGWDVTRGGVPKPMGGCWISVKVDGYNAIQVVATPHIHDPLPVNPVEEVYSGIVFPEE